MGVKRALNKTIKNTKKIVRTTTNFIGLTSEKDISRYEYPVYKFFPWFILYFLMSVASLLTLLPLAYYLYSKKKVSLTYYDNKKLRFDGTVSKAYGAFIQGFLLTLIILALVDKLQHTFLLDYLSASLPGYAVGLIRTAINALPTVLASSLIFNGLFKWAQANTHFCYELNGSYMERKIIKGMLVAILGKLLGLVSFGIGNPIAIWFKQRFIVNRQYFSYTKMKFNGTIFQSYKWFIWRLYLVFITAGIYYPIYLHKVNEWTINHSHCS